MPRPKTYIYDEAQALNYFNTDKTYLEIAQLVGASEGVIMKLYQSNFSKQELRDRAKKSWAKAKIGELNPMYGNTRDKHPRYKGVISDGKGYQLILKPDWYTGRAGSKHIFYHHYVYCLENNLTEIPLGFDIHHKDGNPLNNDISNLELLSKVDHAKLHGKRSETISEESTSKCLETEGTHSSVH